MSISEQEIRLRVILEDLKAKSDITDLEAELKKLHELGETKIKLKYDKDGNLTRVLSQLRDDSGAIVDYVRTWNAEAAKLEQVSATVSYNFEQAAKSQEKATKETEKTAQALTKATSNASAEIASFKEKVTNAFNGMWEGFTPKKMDVTVDPDGKALRAVVQLTDGVGKLVTGTAVLDKETGELTTSTYKLSENFEKERKSAEDAANATQTAANVTRQGSDSAQLAAGSVGLLSAGNEQVAATSETAGQSIQQAGERTEEAGKKAEKSGKAFTLLHSIFLRLAHTAISAVTRSFREALTEMKNVDSELVVVRKVSDATAQELSALKDRAYEVGAAYGVAASDYLNAAAEMTRAGYREQAGDLAELATKLQLVGDVSQDVANQFLIATDKSYKMNGNYEKLSETIDKLNEIDNNFATSFEKVADGIGLLAPVAAQANVSFDEMAAAIGTVTAVTQRSGTESARALRSLFLNIIKDTNTEIEDGVTWSVEEINNLSDALKKYAPEVVKAAEATGELINPMEAVGALAKSYKEGLLTNQDLFDIVSGLGGKLRTSQLLALIQNWDMYNQMLEKTANAAGSADKEVSNALDSWDVKLNQLKNTFTQFTQSLLDSEDIKGFIDSLNFLLKSIDNPDEFEDKFADAFENAAHKLVERLPRIQKVISQVALTIAKTLIETVRDEALDALKELADGSSKATSDLAKALPDILDNIFQIVGEIAMQSLLDSDLAYNLTVALLEGIIESIPRAFVGLWHGVANAILEASENGLQGWAMNKLANQNGLMGKGARWLFNQIIGSDIFAIDGGYSDAVKEANGIKESFLDSDRELAQSADDVTDAIDDTTNAFSEQSEAVSAATAALANYKKALEGGEKGDNFKSYAEAYKSAVEMFEKGLTGTNAYMSAVDLLFGSGIVDTYEEAGELLGNEFIKAMFEGGGDDFGANAANYIRTHLEDFKGVAIKEADDGTFSLVVDDMEAFAESAKLSVGAVEALVDALDGFDSKELDGTVKKVGELADKDKQIDIPIVSNAEDVFDYISKSVKELDNSVINVKVHTSSSGGIHGGSSGKIDSGSYTNAGGSTVHQSGSGSQHGGSGGNFALGTKSARGGLSLVNEDGAEIIYADGKAWIAGDGNPVITDLPQGAGVFTAKQTREILTRSGINSFVFGRGSNNVMLTDSGGGGSQNDDSITAGGIPTQDNGKTGGKKPTQSLSSILEELSEYIDKILKKAKEALQEQLDAIDEQIDKLKREHDAEEDANKLEELRLKILEAEKRLAEAQQERTVRYFNKETGQWEWMADQKAVAEAQNALEDAQNAYDDEVAEQEYQAQLQALQDQKDALNAAYDDLSKRWSKILEALQESENGSGTTDIAKLLASLGKIAGNATSSDIQEILEELAQFTSNPTSVLDAETTARIMSDQGSTARGGASVLSAMLGSSAYDLNAKGTSNFSTSTSSVIGYNYYINGIQIGSDMMDKPLSQILSVLPIYAN